MSKNNVKPTAKQLKTMQHLKTAKTIAGSNVSWWLFFILCCYLFLQWSFEIDTTRIGTPASADNPIAGQSAH